MRVGECIKSAAREQVPQSHPDQPGVVGPTIACLVGPPSGDHADQRNAVVVSSGALDWQRPHTWTGVLDRSPCGTATCARDVCAARPRATAPRPRFRNEGPLGTVFTGRLVAETQVAGHAAVVPTITGRAWTTGYARYVLDPDDPFPAGFTVGDIWGAGTAVGQGAAGDVLERGNWIRSNWGRTRQEGRTPVGGQVTWPPAQTSRKARRYFDDNTR